VELIIPHHHRAGELLIGMAGCQPAIESTSNLTASRRYLGMLFQRRRDFSFAGFGLWF